MNKLNGWITATAVNGDEIRVKIVPLERKSANEILYELLKLKIELEQVRIVTLILMEDLFLLRT